MGHGEALQGVAFIYEFTQSCLTIQEFLVVRRHVIVLCEHRISHATYLLRLVLYRQVELLAHLGQFEQVGFCVDVMRILGLDHRIIRRVIHIVVVFTSFGVPV